MIFVSQLHPGTTDLVASIAQRVVAHVPARRAQRFGDGVEHDARQDALELMGRVMAVEAGLQADEAEIVIRAVLAVDQPGVRIIWQIELVPGRTMRA